MKIEVARNLSFGDIGACLPGKRAGKAVVHACKAPCHKSAVRYFGKSIPENHPNFLFLEREKNLYLNMIDPDVPLFRMESFTKFLDFAQRHIKEREVIIHCNRGESRAPSLALLFMAKRLKSLPAESYDAAASEFASKFPCCPSSGIQLWLREHWSEIE